jgi:hypothetical protein
MPITAQAQLADYIACAGEAGAEFALEAMKLVDEIVAAKYRGGYVINEDEVDDLTMLRDSAENNRTVFQPKGTQAFSPAKTVRGGK